MTLWLRNSKRSATTGAPSATSGDSTEDAAQAGSDGGGVPRTAGPAEVATIGGPAVDEAVEVDPLHGGPKNSVPELPLELGNSGPIRSSLGSHTGKEGD